MAEHEHKFRDRDIEVRKGKKNRKKKQAYWQGVTKFRRRLACSSESGKKSKDKVLACPEQK